MKKQYWLWVGLVVAFTYFLSCGLFIIIDTRSAPLEMLAIPSMLIYNLLASTLDLNCSPNAFTYTCSQSWVRIVSALIPLIFYFGIGAFIGGIYGHSKKPKA